jgi:hypothetical protein
MDQITLKQSTMIFLAGLITGLAIGMIAGVVSTKMEVERDCSYANKAYIFNKNYQCNPTD